MEIMRGNVLFRHLLGEYSKNPRGWNFMIGPSPKDNFFDGIFTGPGESWQLKLDSIFKPAPIVLGAKVESSLQIPNPNTLSYGYRKLEPDVIMKLFKEVSEENDSPRTSRFEEILGSLNPVAPTLGENYAQGPVLFSNRKILGVSPNQKQLDERLSAEIKKLLRESYPGYG